MSDLKSRIRTIEKKTQSKKSVLPILLTVRKENGKIYYSDETGKKREYIQSEHTEKPILVYFKRQENRGSTL